MNILEIFGEILRKFLRYLKKIFNNFVQILEYLYSFVRRPEYNLATTDFKQRSNSVDRSDWNGWFQKVIYRIVYILRGSFFQVDQ